MGSRIDTYTRDFRQRISLAPFPHIEISIRADGSQLLSAQLFLSDSFTFHFDGPTDSPLYQELSHLLLLYAQKKLPSFPSFSDTLPQMGSFQKQVLAQIAQVPFGKTISYRELAQKASHPKAYRAVGSACGKNPFPLLIPCHRIIQANGKLGGFSLDLEIKRRLLAFERESQPE